MAKKYGKLVALGVVAGVAASGVYLYLQHKNKQKDEFDEFECFDEEEDKKPESRKYITLDSAMTFVNDTFEKAKDSISDTITKVSKKFSNSDEDDDDIEYFDDDADFFEEEPAGAADTAQTEASTKGNAETTDNASAKENADVEEFFDDEEEENN
ncbi:MAG: hypothetical protein ACI4DU_00095 [Lachnospiraceae bacterium]